jgi:hypothetical protein
LRACAEPRTQAQRGARKRPRLVPVTGEIIIARIGPAGQTWRALRYCLQDESLRQAIEALGPRQARTASVLRLLDVALRMLHGERMAGTRPASRGSDDEFRRETAHGPGQGSASGGDGCPG